MMTEGREIAARAGFVKRVLSWAARPSTGTVQYITSATNPKVCICRNAYAGFVIPKTAIPKTVKDRTDIVFHDERFFSLVMADVSGDSRVVPLVYACKRDIPMQLTKRKVACFINPQESDPIERKCLASYYNMFGSICKWICQKGCNLIFYDAHGQAVGIVAQVVRR
jgi:hypothetical protein